MTNDTNNASSITVNTARLSFVWAELLPDFLSKNAAIEWPFSSLTRSFTYPSLFNEVLVGGDINQKFSPPWLPRKKQKFWMRYLIQGDLKEVRGTQAWSHLVPLRVNNLGFKIAAEWFDGSCFIDPFYYPFGVAVAITFKWKPNCSLEDLQKKAFEFKQGRYSILGENSPPLSLERIADKVFDTLRQNALGADSISGHRTIKDPLSLITIVEAEGVTPGQDVRNDKGVMKALEVLTNWPSDVDYLQLPNPDKVCLSIKSGASIGSALYARPRGTAVWLPALSLVEQNSNDRTLPENNQRAEKLKCYHRNLFFASLQTECLGLLISYTAELFEQGKREYDLTQHHRQMVKNAAERLKKLYLGDKESGDTWRSSCVKRQIDNNCFKYLQRVLEEFKVPKL